MNRRLVNLAANIGTAAAVAVAAYVLTTERLLPAWRELAVVREGDRIGAPIELVFLASDSVFTVESGTILALFRSTCPACERAALPWLELSASLGRTEALIAIALESPEAAQAYAEQHMPGVSVARPVAADEFVTRFDIRSVPTTLVIDRAGRLGAHRVGPLSTTDIQSLAALTR